MLQGIGLRIGSDPILQDELFDVYLRKLRNGDDVAWTLYNRIEDRLPLPTGNGDFLRFLDEWCEITELHQLHKIYYRRQGTPGEG